MPSARQAWGILENLTALGKTILLTTHYMDQAQHLADRIAVIDRGKIVAEGIPRRSEGGQTGRASFDSPSLKESASRTYLSAR